MKLSDEEIDNQKLCEACPECGWDEFEKGLWFDNNHEHICTHCGQSWFDDIDYSKVL